MSNENNIGSRIRTLREQAQLDQAVVADAVGTARSHLTNIERGRSKPGRDLLMAFARYFDVSVDWLATGLGERAVLEPLSPAEAIFIKSLRQLPEGERDLHMRLVISRASNENES